MTGTNTRNSITAPPLAAGGVSQQIQSKTAECIANALPMVQRGENENPQDLPDSQVRPLRPGVHQAPSVEAILQPEVRVSGVVRKASKIASRQFAIHRGAVDRDPPEQLPHFTFGNRLDCTYCGDPPNCQDHVIAVSYQHGHYKARRESNGPMCWACGDCNRALYNRYFDTFKARCEWARWRIEKKVKPIEWHQRELMRLDYTVRSYCEQQMRKSHWLRSRSDWYQSREFYLNLESLVWETIQLRGGGAGSKFLLGYFASIIEDIQMLYE